MQISGDRQQGGPGVMPDDRHDAVASQVLSVVAKRLPAASRHLHEPHVESLCAAVTRSDREVALVVSHLMQTQRIPAVAMVDLYIPEVARRLGAQWCEDTRSFVEVTIGLSRLQGLVREMGQTWRAAPQGPHHNPTVALIVPQDEHHTLAAMVVTSQYRRMGVSVRLVLGRSDCEVAEQLDRSPVDMIGISVSGTDRLESTRNLIKMLRIRISPVPPIVVGGPLHDFGHQTKIHTGADHFSSDPAEALRLCGLILSDTASAATATS